MMICSWILILFFIQLDLAEKAAEENGRFSSFQCIGGSQVLDTGSMKQAAMQKFPMNEAEHRTCLFRDVCMVDGELTFYVSANKNTYLSGMKDYLPEGFDGGKMLHTGHLRSFTMPIKTVVGAVPEAYSFHHSKIAFLDANSWSFNYGHYFIDNVIPTFTAAKLFNIPFTGTQQIIETNCRLFSSLEEGFSTKQVDYNHSLGTYQQACLDRVDKLWTHFFDNAPIYADAMKDKSQKVCFKRLIAGQGSTFGLKSIDLTRGVILREFRDYVVNRVPKPIPPQENIVLVGLRVQGSAGGAMINNLCEETKKALGASPYDNTWRVECIIPSELGLYDEICAVQRAKVIISVHGTISYMSLFTRDGTQTISIANPSELKENQILLYATHFQTLYLTWNRLEQLPALLEHTLSQSDAFHNDKSD